MMAETDLLLRRLQLGALIWCSTAALVGLMVWPRRIDVAAGIVGGGALTAVSFVAIKSSIDAVLRLLTPIAGTAAGEPSAPGGATRRLQVAAVIKIAGRYALLAVLAYVMIARLRLHPIGLVVGASSLVVSASFEAARWVSRTH